MTSLDSPTIVAAKQHIRATIALLREHDLGYADLLQDLLDGMKGWFVTKENMFKVGEICHARALGDMFVPGFTSEEWL
ncbi:MAG: type I-E CRISPR-associated protein Cse2/CasB [Deltaproteobacteria bacterium]|nr:type I-E CRISPR-associated protein Cse2/CasB [Deltaproteobacteria bacterium]